MVDFRLLTCALFLFTELAQTEAAPTEGATPAERILATFSLRDYLNRNWHKELVTFKVDPKLLGRKDVTLLDVDRQSVPFQWQTGSNAGIAFLASVPRFTRVEYRLVEGRGQRTEGGRQRTQTSAVRGRRTEEKGRRPLPWTLSPRGGEGKTRRQEESL